MVFWESEGPCQASRMSLELRVIFWLLAKKKKLDLAVMDWTPGEKKNASYCSVYSVSNLRLKLVGEIVIQPIKTRSPKK